MAIENVKKHLILALLIWNITFWLYVSGQKKGDYNPPICH